MTEKLTSASCDLPLFVPANKLNRLHKALQVAHDAVIVDFEDAVPANDKRSARDALADASAVLENSRVSVFVRVNAVATDFHADDVALCVGLPLAGIMLPKAETGDQLAQLRARQPEGRFCLALVETAAGISNLRRIAPEADRIAFGSIDYCADLGCDLNRLALLQARQLLVLESRLAALPAPLDGVTTQIHDRDAVRDDACHAAVLGFGGKLLIHPAQIAPAREGFAPSPESIEWAEKVLAANQGGAVALNGEMIDEPVLIRARAVLARVV